MELPHLGETCIICKRIDYLPFKCSYCDRIVCIDHKTNHGLDCSLNKMHFDQSQTEQATKISLKQACDYCKKITLKLELVECPQCQGSHCLYHRHQVQHNCPQLLIDKETFKRNAEEKLDKQKEALNKLKESVKSTSNYTSATPTAKQKIFDPKKQDLVRRVQLMRIKQGARGPPNILEHDKIFFEVIFLHDSDSPLSDIKKNGSKIKIFTTSKHTIGRMVDWSADELGLNNKNDVPEASQLIFKVQSLFDEKLIILNNQESFSHYLDGKILFNGDEISLTYSKPQL